MLFIRVINTPDQFNRFLYTRRSESAQAENFFSWLWYFSFSQKGEWKYLTAIHAMILLHKAWLHIYHNQIFECCAYVCAVNFTGNRDWAAKEGQWVSGYGLGRRLSGPTLDASRYETLAGCIRTCHRCGSVCSHGSEGCTSGTRTGWKSPPPLQGLVWRTSPLGDQG